MQRHTYLKMSSIEDARALWMAKIKGCSHHIEEEKIPLAESLHRILSRPAEALRSSPAFHGAAMDGVAVHAEDTYTASTRTPLRMEIGKNAFWINTGHPLPQGCNAVIMAEYLNTVEAGRAVITEKAAFPWQHVRKLGEDMVATEIILAPGTQIGSYEIGALAAGGVLFPTVYKKTHVAIIPSGDEIAPLNTISEEELTSGKKLPEFNSLVFSAIIQDAGAVPEIRPVVRDDPDEIKGAILSAIDSGAELVILNAGSSAGSKDFSADVIQELGELYVHGITVMPGKPTALGMIHRNERDIPIIGAPGYPVSAVVALEEFLVPVLCYWLHSHQVKQETMQVCPSNPIPSRPGMEERIRVKLGIVDDVCYAVPLPRGAGTVTSLSRADAIITIPRDSEGLNAGESVAATLLRSKEDIEGGLLAIGSHDNTLDIIDTFLRKRYGNFRLASAHVGSLGGLTALKKGQAHFAGCHLLDENTGIYNQRAIREQLPNCSVALVQLVEREQGLILLKGNPKNIKTINDLARYDVRFINRQRGSGTRLLLDYQLKQQGILPSQIIGYRDEEYTHMNIAAAVLSGRADVGLGVHSAAFALGLDFLPIGVEEYDLVIPMKYLQDLRIEALLEVIRSEEFKNKVNSMGGYNTQHTGEIIWTNGV